MLPIPFDNPATYPGHSGVDFGQPTGTPIPASGEGRVLSSGAARRAGNYVWVRYAGTPDVLYAHLVSLNGVPDGGTPVAEGTLLGYVGSTGNSTGPHLHIEVEGYASTDGFWRWFTPERVVNGGTTNQTSRPVADIQRVVGTVADGILGLATTTIRTWQAANGLEPDGIWGILSDAIAFPLIIDGIPGPRTLAKLQHIVGARIDGLDGPETTRCLQRALGVPVDGIRGPITVRALQAAVGAAQDGEEGPDTWSHVQEFLNAGRSFPQPEPVTPPFPPTPRLPVYPLARRAWNVPLARPRERTSTVRFLILHHQASTGDDETYFTTRNVRGSCPTWQIKTDGTVIELIPPALRPSSTGQADEEAVTIEFQNASGNVSGTGDVSGADWVITPAQHAATARIALWLSAQTEFDAVPADFRLDREHLFGDRETTARTGIPTRPTACPGPSVDIDEILDRAIALRDQGIPVVCATPGGLLTP